LLKAPVNHQVSPYAISRFICSYFLWLANFERCLAWTFIERRALAQ